MSVPAKRFHGTPNTPAESTKILKGIGGGSSAGTMRARRSHLSNAARVRSTCAFPKRRSRSGSPPRRPITHSTLHPASDPRVAMVMGIHAEAGSTEEEVTTRMSLISGRLRKEESKKATTNKPAGPSAGNSTFWIQRTILSMGSHAASGGREEELLGVRIEVEHLAVARPVEGGRELALGFRLREALLQPLQESRARRAPPLRALDRAPDVGDERDLPQAAAEPLLPLRLFGRGQHPAFRRQLDVACRDPHEAQPLGRLGDGQQIVKLVAE